MKPYYDDGSGCACGCGAPASSGRQYISGHNLKHMERTEAHKKAIGEAQRRAWETKRKRYPVGSRNLDTDGYARVKVDDSGRWGKEHRLVVEAHIGRKLQQAEHVHHINTIRNDNSRGNLFLCRDVQHHKEVENTFWRLLPEMLNRGIIVFDRETGAYRLA